MRWRNGDIHVAAQLSWQRLAIYHVNIDSQLVLCDTKATQHGPLIDVAAARHELGS